LWASRSPLRLFLRTAVDLENRQRGEWPTRAARGACDGPSVARQLQPRIASTCEKWAGSLPASSPDRGPAGFGVARMFRPICGAAARVLRFLTARVQLKIDAEFPRFSQHLLHGLSPPSRPTRRWRYWSCSPTCPRVRWPMGSASHASCLAQLDWPGRRDSLRYARPRGDAVATGADRRRIHPRSWRIWARFGFSAKARQRCAAAARRRRVVHGPPGACAPAGLSSRAATKLPCDSTSC